MKGSIGKIACCIMVFVSISLDVHSVDAGNKKSVYPESPFGIHFDWIVNRNQVKKISRIANRVKALGVRNILIFLPWKIAEPSKGRYDWTIPDEIIRQFDGYDARFLIRLSAISDWGTPITGKRVFGKYNSPAYPVEIDAYKQFLVALVERYHRKVKYWQIENEVYGMGEFWAGTPRDYISLLKTSFEKIKEVDGSAKVIPAGIALGTIDIDQIDKFMRASRVKSAMDFVNLLLSEARDFFDILDIHLYHTYQSIEKRMAYFKNRMAKFGYQKPIVVTEVGGPDIRAFVTNREFNTLRRYAARSRHMTETDVESIVGQNQVAKTILVDQYREQRDRLVAQEVIKRYVSCIDSGAEQIFWLLLSARGGPDPLWEKMALVDRRGSPNAGYYALQLVIEKLAGFKTIRKFNPGRLSHGYEISKTHGKVYVLWSDPGERIVLNTPWDQVLVTNGIGQYQTEQAKNGSVQIRLDSMPVFVESD